MNQTTVLIVEDDAALREAVCDTLDLAGYPVTFAENGDTALELMAKKDIGMVISDVQMKPMDGHALLKKIRARRPEVPVLLMTAYGSIQKAVMAMQGKNEAEAPAGALKVVQDLAKKKYPPATVPDP